MGVVLFFQGNAVLLSADFIKPTEYCNYIEIFLFSCIIIMLDRGDTVKLTTVIDKDREEEVIIYLHEENEISQKIEELISQSQAELIGYTDNSVTILQPKDIYCFTVENNKIFALTEKERYRLKQRLYVLEETLGDDFLKINQSCIVNIKAIRQFDVSLGGSLMILLKNGYRDYVSRRQLKTVKERIGFKI